MIKMNHILKKLIVLLLTPIVIGLGSVSLDAQTETVEDSLFYPVRFVDFSVDYVLPLGTFKEALDRNLWGFTFSYLHQRNSKNVDYFGAQFNYAHIGSTTGSFLDLDVKTSTNHFSTLFLYRNYPDFYFWRIEPFLEVALGPQFFYTVTTTTFLPDQTNDLDFNEFDVALAYGLNAGFSMHIYGQVFFLYKMGYYGGTPITYLVDEDVPFSNPIEAFSPETSSTNRLRFNFGVAVSF